MTREELINIANRLSLMGHESAAQALWAQLETVGK